MLQAFLDKLDLRQQRLLAGGCLLLLAAALFSYGLLPQIKTYRAGLESRKELEQLADQDQAVSEQLERLNAEVEGLKRQLHGDMANLPEEQLESFVIGRLQAISWRSNVELVSIQPSAGETVEVFRESLFKVAVNGSYFDLFQWLDNISEELGFVVIREYAMSPVEDVARDPNLAVNLTIASYRLEES